MGCGSDTITIGRPTAQSANNIRCNTAGTSNCNTGCGSSLVRRARDVTKSKIRDYVLASLGAPRVAIELTEQQVDIAIEYILQIFEDYAPRDFFQNLVIRATPGKSVYKMPDDVGVVRNVFYKQMATFAFQASDLDGAIPIEYFYPGGAYSSIQGGLIDPLQPIWGRAGEWTLYKQYEHVYARVSSSLGGWEWVGDHKHIKIYPTPYSSNQFMIVNYLQKCKDWNQVHQVMQDGALWKCMNMLGMIRGKYRGSIGPTQMTLDYDYLLQRSDELRKEWLDDLMNRYSDILPITMA